MRRTVRLAGVASTDPTVLCILFREFGTLYSNVYVSKGFVSVSFNDARSARACIMGLRLQGLDCRFPYVGESNIPSEETATLRVSGIEPTIAPGRIAAVFGRLWETREVLPSVTPGVYFIEFYSISDCIAAHDAMKGAVVAGRSMILESVKSLPHSVISLRASTDAALIKMVDGIRHKAIDKPLGQSAPAATIQDAFSLPAALVDLPQLVGVDDVWKPRLINGDDEWPAFSSLPSAPRANESRFVEFSSEPADPKKDVRLPRRPADDPTNPFFVDRAKLATGSELRTTLMVRHVPAMFTAQTLMEMLNQHVEGLFDFVYLPIDFKLGVNVGYAFVNLRSPKNCIKFYNKFHGYQWDVSGKACEVTFARIQGRNSLATHYQQAASKQEHRALPVVMYESGEVVELPVLPSDAPVVSSAKGAAERGANGKSKGKGKARKGR